MKPLSVKHLSVLLAATLLLCHGVFGVVHLICDPPRCVAAEHVAEHQAAQAETAAGEHEHSVGHGTATEYFAVLAGLLGLLLGLLPKGVASRLGIGARRPPGGCRAPAVFCPARGPHLPSSRCSSSEGSLAPVTRSKGPTNKHHTSRGLS